VPPTFLEGPPVSTTPVSGAVISGPTSITLYVSNEATNGYARGDDANRGTAKSAPLRTINEAARRANLDQAGRDAGFTGARGTRIVINDGSYRELIDLRTTRRDFDTGATTAADLSDWQAMTGQEASSRWAPSGIPNVASLAGRRPPARCTSTWATSPVTLTSGGRRTTSPPGTSPKPAGPHPRA
jgi:hypothetical protein